jgi:endonuclease/exonuclease/phosphatase (EEP) superfamily protein YafD
VAALILTAVALPFLLARMADGRLRRLTPALASLSPIAVLPAVAAVVVGATTSWWLVVLLAVPAALLAGAQLPPRRPRGGPRRPEEDVQRRLTIRLLTVNVLDGSADAAAVVRLVREHNADVLAIQELTPQMVRKFKDADLAALLPFTHLDPRPRAIGSGLWARWPIERLPPVPRTWAAAPRARIDPSGGHPVTLTAVHPKAPVNRNQERWRNELETIRDVLASTEGPQIVAGDFNASRDHRPFRDILAAGFADCGDAARDRPWPGFTWPSMWPGLGVKVYPPILPFMRLDHVLISRDGCTAREVQILRVPGTDHCAVLATIDLDLAP